MAGKFETMIATRLTEIEAWARDGLTDEQISHNLGICVSSLYNYRKLHPELVEALRKGKEVADLAVENALYKRAIGYRYGEVTTDANGAVKTVTKEALPDVTAQIFWLKNRKPADWRDKQNVEYGNGGEFHVRFVGPDED